MPDMNNSSEVQVAGLLKEMDSLDIPFYLESTIRESLGIVIAINGTTDETKVILKRILFLQAQGTIMHFRYVKDMQKIHLDGCLVNRKITIEDGKPIMPWEKDLEALKLSLASMQEEERKEEQEEDKKVQEQKDETSCISFSLPYMKDALKIKGKIAAVVVGWLLTMGTLFTLMYCMMTWNNKEIREENIKEVRYWIQQLSTNQLHVIHQDDGKEGT